MIVGYLGNIPITQEELDANPTMVKDPQFLPAYPERDTTKDWKCDYCNCINPSDKYECTHCGAPKKKSSEPKSGYVDDDSTCTEIYV